LSFKTEVAFRNIYTNKLESSTIQAISEDILALLKTQSVGYLFLIYNGIDQRPNSKIKHASNGFPVNLNNEVLGFIENAKGSFGSGDEALGQANDFNNIYCNVSFIDIAKNRVRINSDLWADPE
jgi:hypothetical protein